MEELAQDLERLRYLSFYGLLWRKAVTEEEFANRGSFNSPESIDHRV